MDRFTITPSYSSGVSTDHRVLAAQFGDGYQQRAADGINAMRRRFMLRFSKIRSAKAAEVIAFLEAHGGVTAFIWTPPAPHDTPRAWVIKPPWDHTYDEHDSETVICEFVEDHNPATRAELPVIDIDAVVTITTGSVGATIRYTLDGTDPKETEGTLYEAPFTTPAAETVIKAIAYRTDVLPSEIASEEV